MLVLLFIFVMLLQSGCSLTAERSIERYLGNNSICWEDNDHILIYANIAQYWYNQNLIGGESKEYDWTGGEIWRINASTGSKELLFRSKDSKYSAFGWPENMRMDISSGHIYVSNDLITYKVREDYSEWDSIGYFTLPIISDDEKTVVAYDTEEYSTVKRYNLENNTSEELYVNDVLIEWLDYDYERNYLLINSNKFVDLNTGEETIIAEITDTIGKYIVSDVSFKNGKIINNYISTEVLMMDTSNYDNEKTRKIRMNISNREYEVLENVIGILSPDGLKYASGYPHSVLITDTLGEWINNVEFDGDEL